MAIGAIDIPARGVEDLRKVLNGLEVKLSDAKAQRDRILIDVRKASAAADTGDQRARFAHGGLNKEDAAAGRLISSLEVQIAEARKSVEMAESQVATVEAKRAHQDGLGEDAVKWFEVSTPDKRLVRHRAATLEALRKSLLPNYRVTAEVFGASDEGIGGFVASIGPGAKSPMSGLLAAHGDELVAFLAERGIKAV